MNFSSLMDRRSGEVPMDTCTRPNDEEGKRQSITNIGGCSYT